MKLISHIQSSGHEFGSGEEFLGFRFRLLNALLLLAMAVALFFNLLDGLRIYSLETAFVWVNYGFAFANLMLLFYLRQSKACYRQGLLLFLVLVLLECTMALFWVRDDTIRPIWYVLLILVAFMLADAVIGYLTLATVLAVITAAIQVTYLPLNQHETITLMVVLVVMAFILHLYTHKTRQLAILMHQHSAMTDRQINRDPLTGCLLMSVFNTLASERMALASSEHEPVSLLYIDLDSFHQIESHYGLEMGQTVLQHSVKQIESVLRQDDLLARYGGDKFIILICGIDETLTQTVAERLRSSIASLEYAMGGESFTMTASIGISVMEAADERLELLKHRADRALYRAKYLGRNRVELAKTGIDG